MHFKHINNSWGNTHNLLICILLCIISEFCLSQSKSDMLLDSADRQYANGNYQASLASYEQYMKIESKSDKSFQLAKRSEKIAYMYYWEKQWEKSEKFYKLNLEYLVLNKKGPEDIARGLIGLGAIYQEKGNNSLTLKYLLQAENLLSISGNSGLLLADVNTRIGNIYYTFGDYNKALRYLLLGNEIAQKQDHLTIYYQILSFFNISNAYFMNKQYENALVYYEKLLSIKDLSSSDRCQASSQMALCYFRMGEPELAKKYFRAAIENEGCSNPDAYLNYGRFLTLTANYYKAIIYLKKSLKVFYDLYGENHSATIGTYYFIGDYFLRQENADSALHYFQYALTLLCPTCHLQNWQNPDFGSTPFIQHLLPILEKKGAAMYLMALQHSAEREYWLKQSVSTYDDAIEWISQTYSGYQSDDSRIFLSETESPVFSDAIAVCRELYSLHKDPEWIQKAFIFAERGKAGALMATFRDRDALKQAGIPSMFSQADKNLNAEVYKLEQQLTESGSEADSSKKLIMRQKLVELYKVREQLKQTVALNYPEYSFLLGKSKIPTLTDICVMLPDDAAFIEYVCSDTVLYIFIARHSTYTLIPVGIDSSFYTTLQTYRQLISSTAVYSGISEYKNYLISAYKIWAVMLKPCESYLKNKTRVMISTDAKLGAVCFDGLIDKLPDTATISYVDYRSPDYLVKKYAFSYCYSASWMMNASSRSQDVNSGLVVFAPTYEINDTSTQKLPSLEGARKEAENIAHEWNGVLYTDDRASVKQFISSAPRAGIIHLAMHSQMDENKPLLSKLMFNNSDNDSSFLTAADIYGISINTSLVVIGSCNSGYGKSVQGEGMMSLARAFIYAGSQSVVMSLWPVNDASGASVMQNFYEELESNQSMDVALQKAKIKFLQSSGSINSHPSYWSAYVLTGQGKVPDKPDVITTKIVIYAVIILIILTILFWMIYYIRKRLQ
jgi:CHAT domain-containing protein